MEDKKGSAWKALSRDQMSRDQLVERRVTKITDFLDVIYVTRNTYCLVDIKINQSSALFVNSPFRFCLT